MDKDEAVREIRLRGDELIGRFMQPAKKKSGGKPTYICPICGNGSGETGTGIAQAPADEDGAKKWKCFKCPNGTFGDVIDWYGHEMGVTDFVTIRDALAGMLGITIDNPSFTGQGATKEKSQNKPQNKPREATGARGGAAGGQMAGSAQKSPQAVNYMDYYKRCNQNLEDPRAKAYLEGRGISVETARRYNLGFDPQADPAGGGHPCPRIIIPTTTTHYVGRSIDPATPPEYAKLNPKGSKPGIFNSRALSAQEADVVFVLEGVFDALSVLEVGKQAIALDSTSNARKLLEVIEEQQAEGKLTRATFVLCLDNDKAGENAKNALRDGLTRLRIPFLVADISPGCKDANEYFVKDRAGFKAAVEAAAAADPEKPQQAPMEAAGTQPPAGPGQQPEGQPPVGSERQAGGKTPAGSGQQSGEQPQAPKPMTGPETVDAFMELVQDQNKPFEPIPTGIRDIDRALGGGFTRKTLVTLGAPPAMGKTAIAQWIMEGVAKGGRDVLYLNLEMAREQLIARSLSRIVWKRHKGEEGLDLSAMDILRGYAWTEAQKAAITAAAAEYKREIAAHFVYNPDGMNNRIDKILEAMRSEVVRLKELGRPAPIVCVDYLQIVDHGDRRDPVEGLKNAIFQLKEFAKNHDTVVLAIVAHNRESNKRGVSDMESGRDTSAIEYSGDVMLGLSYTAIEDGQTVTFDYVDAEGATQTAKETATIDAIRRAKRGAHDLGIDVPVFCNKLSLKVMKGRFSDSEHVARFVFDGRHSTFSQLERMKGGGFRTLQEGESTPFDEPEGQADKGAKGKGTKGASSKGKRR